MSKLQAMTHEQILTKAIKKAESNGFDWPSRYAMMLYYRSREVHVGFDLIFNHDFAKALWTEEAYPLPDGLSGDLKYVKPVFKWQYHLQQMVIAEDPIKYLGEHL